MEQSGHYNNQLISQIPPAVANTILLDPGEHIMITWDFTQSKYIGSNSGSGRGYLVLSNRRILSIHSQGLLTSAYKVILKVDLSKINDLRVSSGFMSNGLIIMGTFYAIQDPEMAKNHINNARTNFMKSAPAPQAPNIPTPPATTHYVREKEVTTREVVKIRCQFCGCLYDEVIDKCPSCGAR